MSVGVFIPEIADRFHVFLMFAKSILCHICIHLTMYSLWLSVLFVTISGPRCWMYYTYRYILCTQETSIILMENISGVSVFNFENYETRLAYVSCESWNQWRYWFIQWTRYYAKKLLRHTSVQCLSVCGHQQNHRILVWLTYLKTHNLHDINLWVVT
jgi:hypothetical protein